MAWLYAPGSGINYVVAQAEDNDYYLHRLLNGTEAKAGTLFMDYQNHSDFSDWNTMIYGPVSYTHLDVYKRQAYQKQQLFT